MPTSTTSWPASAAPSSSPAAKALPTPAASSSSAKAPPAPSSSASPANDPKDMPTQPSPASTTPNRASSPPAPSSKPANDDDDKKNASTSSRSANAPPTNSASSSQPAVAPPNIAQQPVATTPPQGQSPGLAIAPTASSAPSATPPATVSQQACRKSTDCTSKICISGFCATSSGFALSPSTLSNGTLATSSVPFVTVGKKGQRVSPTACSDPRCTLPADLAGLNGLDADSSNLGPSDTHAVSNAALAGIVLSLLLLFLFLLLIIPKVQGFIKAKVEDWRNRKDEARQRELGGGSPEFGNEDASVFEKKRGYESSFISSSPTLMKEGGEVHQVVVMDQYQRSYGAVDQPVSFAGVGARRKAISFAANLPQPSMNKAPMNTYPAMPQQARQPRETVLPYTVGFEEDKEALMGLRGIASPSMPGSNNAPFEPVTPTMPSSAAFFSNPASPNTPGSAYSARTALLPTSLQAGRQPIISAVRPNMRMPLGSNNGSHPPIRPTMQRLPSVKVTPSSMISEMEWVSGQSPKRQ